jgi:hypothetical protein
MSDPLSDFDPQTALGLVQTARADVAERVNRIGLAYDFAYAVLAGGMVAAQALPLPLNTLGIAVGIAGLGLLAQQWTRRTGVWVSGVSPRRARWVAIALGLVMAIAMLGLTYAGRSGLAWLALPVGAVSAVAAYVFSRLWRRVWLREIEGGA